MIGDASPMDGGPSTMPASDSPLPEDSVASNPFVEDWTQHLVHSPLVVLVFGASDSGSSPVGPIVYRWVRQGVADERVDALIEAVASRATALSVAGSFSLHGARDWQVLVQPIAPTSVEFGAGAVVIARDSTGAWAEEDRTVLTVFADMLREWWTKSSGDTAYRRSLDALVVQVAEHLVSATTASLQKTMDWTVQTLAEFLQADVAFLRDNDHAAGNSVLVAEYPRRPEIPDPDPLGVVPFDADPLFSSLRDLAEPLVTSTSVAPPDYGERVADGSGVTEFSGVAVPLIHEGVTRSCLGFLRFTEREWTASELNALLAVAALLVQLTMRTEAEEQLRFSALHDDLTGLFNRRALLDELDRRITRAPGRTALLFLDLDRFKVMNDYLGHAAGDRVLAGIAERIRSSLRSVDFAARLGGDEFVVLLEDTGRDFDAVAMARRVLNLVEQPIEVNGQGVSHTASIGIALARSEQIEPLELIRRADTALYAAKALGHNEVVVFNEAMQKAADSRSDMELVLRNAISDNGLRLFYQPEFDLDTGRLLAVEALVRLEHPTRGLLTAGAFITVAEDAGLVIGMGSWVLEEACRQLARWRYRYPHLDLVVRVNMSPAELAVSGIVEHVELCLRLAGVPPSALCVEITEHAIVPDLDHLVSVLDKLRMLGVHLAIDDFGTGHSSMTQLKQLPVDVLKVDMTFVDGLADDPTDQAIVAAIVGLGRALGLDVVAEGVERPDDMRVLSSLGCHRAQGFLLGRPASAADLDPLLGAGSIDLALLVEDPPT